MTDKSRMRQIFDGIVRSETADDAANALYKLFVVAGVAIAIVFVANVVGWFFTDKLGQWGDFFGGTLNPILTSLTFMGLIITIVLQQRELAQSREELARSATALENQIKSIDRQNFEATFFQMLALHNSIVGSMDLQFQSRTIAQGRDCFKRFFDDLAKNYSKQKVNLSVDQATKEAWDEIWTARQQDLGHYFRYLYNIIRFVDESASEENNTASSVLESRGGDARNSISHLAAQRYMKLLRAILSNYELLILFYNSRTERGAKFAKYADKYFLFDNIPVNMLLDKTHKDWIRVQEMN